MLTPEEIVTAKGHKLSENFNLYELIKSKNHPDCVFYPTEEVTDAIQLFVDSVLQPIRNEVGRLNINSGYRNPILNSKVGGVHNSVHQYFLNNKKLGQASDITPDLSKVSLEEVFHWIIDNHEKLGLKTAIIYKHRNFIHLDTRESRPSFVAMENFGPGHYEMYNRG